MDDLKAMSVFTEVAVCLQIETCQVFIPKPSKKRFYLHQYRRFVGR